MLCPANLLGAALDTPASRFARGDDGRRLHRALGLPGRTPSSRRRPSFASFASFGAQTPLGRSMFLAGQGTRAPVALHIFRGFLRVVFRCFPNARCPLELCLSHRIRGIRDPSASGLAAFSSNRLSPYPSRAHWTFVLPFSGWGRFAPVALHIFRCCLRASIGRARFAARTGL